MKKNIQRFGVRTACAVAAMIFAAQAAWALEPFKVQDIRVEGLQRVEPGTIFASMPMRVGDDYNDEKGAAAIRALFALGLFKDVRLEANGNVLVVVVQERPTIADVEFAGSREFDKDALKKSMRDIGLTDGRPFDKALADRAEQELKRQYLNKSFYAADVVTTVTPIERNRVNLTFTVIEGAPARINDIRIVGNKGLQRIDPQRLAGARHWRLVELVHQVRSLRPLQTQCRFGNPALVLFAAWLPRVPHRLDPGGHFAE
jgi:outer membrane protein insertion porin family